MRGLLGGLSLLWMHKSYISWICWIGKSQDLAMIEGEKLDWNLELNCSFLLYILLYFVTEFEGRGRGI